MANERVWRAGSELEGVGVLQQDRLAAVRWKNRQFPEAIGVDTFVVHQIEVIPLPRIVAESEIDGNIMSVTAVLNERCGRQLGVESGLYPKPHDVGVKGLVSV